MSRQFNSRPAIREAVPLLIGLTGPSGSGKTYSALRLAVGIQKTKPGKIVFIGTESRRALHYAGPGMFDFEYVEFKPPFSSLDYIDALEYAESLKPSVIIVDSASHEKEGIGGMLDLHDQEVQRMAGGDYAKQERVKMIAWSLPKQNHRKFINKILQINANIIFCFRAKEISKPMKDKNTGKNVVTEMGFIPVSSDDLVYEMTVNCFLPPHSNGSPCWTSDKPGEKLMMKLPEQFKSVFKNDNIQLDESIGEKLALWAKGDAKPAKKAKPKEAEKGEKLPEVKMLEKLLEAELSDELKDKIDKAIVYINDKGMTAKFKPSYDKLIADIEAYNKPAENEAPELEIF